MRIFKPLWLKLAVIFIVAVIPMTIFAVYVYKYSNDLLRNQTILINNNFLKNNSEEIEHKIDEIQTFYEKTFISDLDSTQLALLVDRNMTYDVLKQRIYIKLRGYIANFDAVDTAFFYYTNSNELVFSTKNAQESNKEVVMRDIENLNQTAVTISKYSWDIIEFKDKFYLRRFFITDSDACTGIWVDIEKAFETVLKSKNENYQNIVFSNEGFAVSKSNISDDLIAKIKEKFNESEDAFFVIKSEQSNKSFVVMSGRISGTGLSLVMVMPQETVFGETRILDKMALILFFSILITIIMFFVFLKNQLTNPMNRLIEAMDKAGKGKLDIEIKESTSYEFSFLAERFSEMIEQIKKLKIDVYEQKLIAGEAERKKLQSQINPHFYMNSLNIIYSLAELKEYELIRKMTVHLADYFKFIIGVNRELIDCKDEIKHIENYLEIQKLRYINQMDFEIRIMLEHLHMKIPPLTLQPFVENCIKHGFSKKEDIFRVIIYSEEDIENNSVRFIIEDNGTGFKDEQLVALNEVAYSSEYRSQHIGIWNVCQRIKKNFTEEAGIKFMNNQTGGATVIINIPRGELLKNA